MSHSKLVFVIYWLFAAVVIGLLTLWAARHSQGAISDCIDATCRITASDGSTGSGCVFEVSQGYVYVLTAAHAVGGDRQVRCEFWRAGHQSKPITGRVITRSRQADAAIVALPVPIFGGVLPKVIPVAVHENTVKVGDTLTSVGCAKGGWSTAWKGHATGSDNGDFYFVPTPANGRSGAALFDAKGEKILGMIRARTSDDANGIATPIAVIDRAFRGQTVSPRKDRESAHKRVQCPGGSCQPPGQYRVFPYIVTPGLSPILERREYVLPYLRHQAEKGKGQDQRLDKLEDIWPTLPRTPKNQEEQEPGTQETLPLPILGSAPADSEIEERLAVLETELKSLSGRVNRLVQQVAGLVKDGSINTQLSALCSDVERLKATVQTIKNKPGPQGPPGPAGKDVDLLTLKPITFVIADAEGNFISEPAQARLGDTVVLKLVPRETKQ